MAAYAILLQRTGSTSLSVGSVTADATRPRRGKLFFLSLGAEGTVADNPFLWQIPRCTAAGTSTSVTPQPLDPADAATEMDAGTNHTIEPTYTANAFLLSLPSNQRATVLWNAYDLAHAPTFPATASNGLGLKTPTAGAVAITATMHVEEQ